MKAGLNDKGTEMSKFRASMILGAALLAGSVATASAADLHRGSIKDSYAPAAPVSSGPSSWYVRIDGGHGRFDDPTMIEDGRFDLTGAKIDDTWTLGGGVGYYFSKNVRADITWDHRFEADARGSIPGIGLTPFPGERKFGLKSDVVMANLYYDIDTRTRFTPYIGVGIGFAHNTTTTGSVADSCACGFNSVSIAGDSKWSTAGALMSGMSINVRDRMHIDAGYRFLMLGDAHTGLITGNAIPAGGGPAAPAQAGDPVMKDLWSHEFRVGLRWDIR